MYYRITLSPKKFETKSYNYDDMDELPWTYDDVIKAENEMKAIAIVEENVLKPEKLKLGDVNLEIKEISITDCIERELGFLRQRIMNDFIIDTYGDVSIREFNKIMRESDNNDELYYETLKSYMKRKRIISFLKRSNAFERMTAKDFFEFADRFSKADAEEFSLIEKELNEKYNNK
jgi:hypothetical protein